MTTDHKIEGSPKWKVISHRGHCSVVLYHYQAIRQCGEEDLLEVVLPRLVDSITPWEFLLVKTEQKRPSQQQQLLDLIQEYSGIQKKLSQMCADTLCLDETVTESEDNKKSIVKVGLLIQKGLLITKIL